MKQPAAILEPRGSIALDDYVADLGWSHDGTRLAVAGGEGKVFLLHRDGESLRARQVAEHGLGAIAVAWQPGGKVFVSSGQDSCVNLYDGDSGERRVQRRPSKQWTTALAWSPNGDRLATAAGREIVVWSAALESERTLSSLDAVVAAIAWDKPGRDLAAAINGGLVLHRLDGDVVEVRRLKWAAPCTTVAFSPNGKVVATGTQDGSVHFWYLATGRDSQMRGYPSRVAHTEWDGDGKYLATVAHDQIVVWDFRGKGPEGSRPVQLLGHTERIVGVAFQPRGGYLATIGLDWRVSLWLPGKAPRALDAHLTDAEPTVLRWSPDGRFIAVGERSGRLTIFELVRLV